MSGCSISTLDYECKTPQQQVIDDVKYLEYPCLSRIGTDTNVPLEFRIEKTSMFTDISQMYLSFNFKLEHTDGTKITEMEQVAPLCNFAYTVFSGVDVKIQDTNVSISDGYYPYLSYVNLLLFATKEEKEHYLREAIWIPDTAGVFDDISNGEEGMNDGYIRRMSKVQFGDEVHVMAKVMLDFKLYQLIPDKTEIYLRFNRTEARKCLIANEDKYKIAMSKARLLVPQINLTSYGRSSIPPSLSLQATRFHIVSRMVGKNDQNCDTNKTPHVHNIACTFEMCLYDLDLQKTQQLFLGEKFFAMYEPELCNGLQLELSGKQRAILHRSGKGILTGFTKEEDIVTSLTYITNFILKHGKADSGQ